MDNMALAVNLILAHVLGELAKSDPKLAAAIKTGFDEAASAAELIAIREPKTLHGKNSLEVLEYVEELRSITLDKI